MVRAQAFVRSWRMFCPRCRAVLATAFGALREDVCSGCHGRFLPPDVVERVLIEESGVSRATLLALVPLFASRERITCPSCEQKMSPVVVHGVRIDLCTGCGGVYCDHGELSALTEGRYAEVNPSRLDPIGLDDDAATVPSSSSAQATLASGTGKHAVFLHSLDALDAKLVAAAFAACPGLVEGDAIALAKNNNVVVVDGVGAQTASASAAALVQQGIAASAVEDSWTTLMAPTMAQTLSVGRGSLRIGDDDVRVELVTCAAAGVVRRTTLRSQRDPMMRPADVELVAVEADDVMLDVFALDPARRLRLQLSRMVLGDELPNRDRLERFRERLAELGRALGRNDGIGRGVRACMSSAPLPRYRSLRDLEREEAWLLWRSLRPGF